MIIICGIVLLVTAIVLVVIFNHPQPKQVKQGSEDAMQERYTVIAGDSLWKIAGKVYNDPTKWVFVYFNNCSNTFVSCFPDAIVIDQYLWLPTKDQVTNNVLKSKQYLTVFRYVVNKDRKRALGFMYQSFYADTMTFKIYSTKTEREIMDRITRGIE